MNEWSKPWCELHFSDAVERYREEHEFCALCGIPADLCHWPHRSGPLQLAHIYGGPNRKQHPCNVLALCERDHRHEHTKGVTERGVRLPEITKGVLLAAKLELGELDCETLEKITGYKAAHIRELVTAIPEHYRAERKRWR